MWIEYGKKREYLLDSNRIEMFSVELNHITKMYEIRAYFCGQKEYWEILGSFNTEKDVMDEFADLKIALAERHFFHKVDTE